MLFNKSTALAVGLLISLLYVFSLTWTTVGGIFTAVAIFLAIAFLLPYLFARPPSHATIVFGGVFLFVGLYLVQLISAGPLAQQFSDRELTLLVGFTVLCGMALATWLGEMFAPEDAQEERG